jgi:peptidoglycan/LPS O-acetylase OafA/YrhL
LRYRPDIDGLRAVAVVPVVFFHLGMEPFSGGYVGVDVFFVISGFLITSLIFPEMRRGEFSIWKFYERRVRRIFPALFAVVGVSTIAAAWLFLPLEFEEYSQSLAATTLFGSNILFWSQADYFDAPAELKPLLHTWSLAVEEQFYIFFPPFLFVLQRTFQSRTNLILWLCFAASLAASMWGMLNIPRPPSTSHPSEPGSYSWGR